MKKSFLCIALIHFVWPTSDAIAFNKRRPGPPPAKPSIIQLKSKSFAGSIGYYLAPEREFLIFPEDLDFKMLKCGLVDRSFVIRLKNINVYDGNSVCIQTSRNIRSILGQLKSVVKRAKDSQRLVRFIPSTPFAEARYTIQNTSDLILAPAKNLEWIFHKSDGIRGSSWIEVRGKDILGTSFKCPFIAPGTFTAIEEVVSSLEANIMPWAVKNHLVVLKCKDGLIYWTNYTTDRSRWPEAWPLRNY